MLARTKRRIACGAVCYYLRLGAPVQGIRLGVDDGILRLELAVFVSVLATVIHMSRLSVPTGRDNMVVTYYDTPNFTFFGIGHSRCPLGYVHEIPVVPGLLTLRHAAAPSMRA